MDTEITPTVGPINDAPAQVSVNPPFGHDTSSAAEVAVIRLLVDVASVVLGPNNNFVDVTVARVEKVIVPA